MTGAEPAARLRQVLLDRMRQVLHAHRLKPHTTGTCERGQEEARPAEERVLDSWNRGDAELHRFLEHADVTRVDAQRVASLEVIGDDLAVQLDPGMSLALQSLHRETGAA